MANQNFIYRLFHLKNKKLLEGTTLKFNRYVICKIGIFRLMQVNKRENLVLSLPDEKFHIDSRKYHK